MSKSITVAALIPPVAIALAGRAVAVPPALAPASPTAPPPPPPSPPPPPPTAAAAAAAARSWRGGAGAGANASALAAAAGASSAAPMLRLRIAAVSGLLGVCASPSHSASSAPTALCRAWLTARSILTRFSKSGTMATKASKSEISSEKRTQRSTACTDAVRGTRRCSEISPK